MKVNNQNTLFYIYLHHQTHNRRWCCNENTLRWNVQNRNRIFRKQTWKLFTSY